ncbi:hypothetical protein AB0L85_29550 [Streptomyces sp. NPDC052051]|uniref:hypothetical protein n=1 Tax=Streptomyces sp. NPDC052051 TaxID=3154649 RepID=UPI0034462081
MKVDLYAVIRRDHQEGMSQRALQHKYNVTWRTVRRALDGKWPEPRRQQRHTAQRIFDRLVDERGAGDISYPMVVLM